MLHIITQTHLLVCFVHIFDFQSWPPFGRVLSYGSSMTCSTVSTQESITNAADVMFTVTTFNLQHWHSFGLAWCFGTLASSCRMPCLCLVEIINLGIVCGEIGILRTARAKLRKYLSKMRNIIFIIDVNGKVRFSFCPGICPHSLKRRDAATRRRG